MAKSLLANQLLLGVGGPTIEAVAVDPRAGAGLARAVGSQAILTTTPEIFLKVGAGATDWIPTLASGFSGFFGDGSIGNLVVAAGTTTEASAVGDVYYDNITIQNGGIYKPQGRRIYVRDTLLIQTGGVIDQSGTNAAGAVGGAATTGYVTQGGTLGGTGTTGAGGNGTNSASLAIPNGTATGVGGAGGLGTSGAGGSAGTQGANSTFGSVRDPVFGLTGFSQGASQAGIAPGTGGGGGGGNGAQNGGGGGGGAGSIEIRARRVIIEGTGVIRAIGGNGAAGLAANCGGGGGGGGGRAIIMCRSYVGAVPTVTGGTQGGSGGGGGAAGSPGADGFAIIIPV